VIKFALCILVIVYSLKVGTLYFSGCVPVVCILALCILVVVFQQFGGTFMFRAFS